MSGAFAVGWLMPSGVFGGVAMLGTWLVLCLVTRTLGPGELRQLRQALGR